MGASPSWGQNADKIDSLYQRLGQAMDAAQAERIAAELVIERTKSGSPAIDLLYQRGNQSLAQGDTEAAIDHLTALLDHAPDFIPARDARAAAYFLSGQTGPALADLAAVLVAEPRDYEAIIGLAEILEETGHTEQALAAYRQAAAIHPWLEEISTAIERLDQQLAGQRI